jgi:hypothetical protein
MYTETGLRSGPPGVTGWLYNKLPPLLSLPTEAFKHTTRHTEDREGSVCH